MKTGLILVTFAGVVGALVLAWSAGQRASAARTQWVTVTREEKDVAARVAVARRQIASAERTQSELHAALAQAEAELKRRQAVARAPTSAPAPRSPPVLAVMLDRNPQLRALYRAQFEAEARLRYAAFFRQQSLSPGQQQRFIALLEERDQGRLDVQDAAATLHCAPNDPAVTELQKKSDAAVDEALTTLLGGDGLAQMRQFESLMRAGQWDEPVRGAEALNPEQARQLSQAMADGRNLYGTAPGAQRERAKVIAEAATFLSPGQVAALHLQLEIRPLLAMMQQYFAGKKANPPGP